MIYLDNSATTRPYKEVVDLMADIMYNHWGNPSSNYSFADDARLLIEEARTKIAADINCKPEEIIFTSSGCESNSLAIRGFMQANPGYSLYVSCLEHSSINSAIAFLLNPKVSIIPCDHMGFISPQYLNDTLSNKPFVSIAGASADIGAIQDVKELADVVHSHNGIFHSDMTQLYPERKIDVQALGLDMMTISAQKFHGPRGAAFLYVKEGIPLKPIIYGTQENSLRGGTYNTAAICGMSKAIELTRDGALQRVRALRDRLLKKLLKIPGTNLNGPPAEATSRLLNNISLTIDSVDAEKLMTLCDLSGVIIARGSACQSHVPTPSKALKAIGLTDAQALSTIRISLDEFNTEEEIDKAADIITKLVERIRNEEN